MATGIEWTDETWNPLAGCEAVSEGCSNCYAAALASGRLAHTPQYKGLAVNGVWSGEVRLSPERLSDPLRWRRPRRVFVNSMADLFHRDVPDEFIAEVWRTMSTASQHQFQILTKRPQRMAEWVTNWYDGYTPLPNVWLGTSIESDEWCWRANHLRNTPASVRFLSLEPLIGPLHSLDLDEIDWVIVGGESGPRARAMHPQWVREIRDCCVEARVPFFMKQWGEWAPIPLDMWPQYGRWVDYDGSGTYGEELRVSMRGPDRVLMSKLGKKRAGRAFDGVVWDQYPKPKVEAADG